MAFEWMHTIWFRLKALFHRKQLDHDLQDEIAFHLSKREESIRKNSPDSAPGEAARSEKESLLDARRQFGNTTRIKESTREMWSFVWLETLGHDIRFGARVHLNRPGFTSMAVLTLALGIGLNTAIFSLFNAAVLRPLAVKDPTRVVNLYTGIQGEPSPGVFSYPEFADCRDQNSVFSGIAGHAGGHVLLGGEGGSENSRPEWLHASLVSANYFDLLGAAPVFGRSFLSEEDQIPGAHPVAILNYGFWQRRFGGDSALVGKTINLNSLPYTVIGIAPRDFVGVDPEVPDLWVPLMMASNVQSGPAPFSNRGVGWLSVIARLKAGVNLAQAQSEMTVLASRFQAKESASVRRATIQVAPGGFLDPREQNAVMPFAILAMIAVGLVMLIACANVANLQLARGVARQKEMGIRASMGASRGRLVRQMVVESLLLTGAAGVVGFFMAWWGSSSLLQLIHPPGTPALSLEVSPDWHVGVFLFGISLFTGLASGLLPALRISRQDPLNAVREEGGATSYRKGSRLRGTLVAGQVAMSLFLLIAAGLLVRALGKAQNTNPGFDTADVAVLSVDLRILGYDATRKTIFYRQLLDRIRSLPGVRAVALSTTVPLGKDFAQTDMIAEGKEPPPGQRLPIVNFNVVSPEFFDTLEIRLLRGRVFTPRDIESGAHVAVVSESLAKKFWPGEEAVGKRFRMGRTLYEVAGVASDARNVYLWSGKSPYLYLPATIEVAGKSQYIDFAILARTDGDVKTLVAALPGLAHEQDPAVPADAIPVSANLATWIWPSEIGAALATVLGLLALLLASVGITSVTAFAVTQRTREIGIRMALGAQTGAVVRLLVIQAGRLVAIGVVIGLAAAVAATRILSEFLYGVSAVDGVTFAAVTILLVGVALVSSYIPARRATKVDPMVALRYT
ncbi:MAG: ABC transporter permease [Candidatus Acidiferrales bacterium]